MTLLAFVLGMLMQYGGNNAPVPIQLVEGVGIFFCICVEVWLWFH